MKGSMALQRGDGRYTKTEEQRALLHLERHFPESGQNILEDLPPIRIRPIGLGGGKGHFSMIELRH